MYHYFAKITHKYELWDLTIRVNIRHIEINGNAHDGKLTFRNSFGVKKFKIELSGYSKSRVFQIVFLLIGFQLVDIGDLWQNFG